MQGNSGESVNFLENLTTCAGKRCLIRLEWKNVAACAGIADFFRP